MSAPAAIAVTLSKTIPLPAEQVFDAWLSAKMISRFMFGPGLREEEIVRLRTDAIVDGRFSFVVRRKGQEINHIGRYLAIDRPRHLAFTWGVAPESSEPGRVLITLQPTSEGGTQLTLVHELPAGWANYVEPVRSAWTKMLGMLETVLCQPLETPPEEVVTP